MHPTQWLLVFLGALLLIWFMPLRWLFWLVRPWRRSADKRKDDRAPPDEQSANGIR